MYQRQQKSVCISVTSWHYLMRKDKMNKFLKEGICFIQVPDGVNFGTEADRKIATLLFVVALKSQRQLSMLQELAFLFRSRNIQRLSDCQTIDEAQKKPKVTSEKSIHSEMFNNY